MCILRGIVRHWESDKSFETVFFAYSRNSSAGTNEVKFNVELDYTPMYFAL